MLAPVEQDRGDVLIKYKHRFVICLLHNPLSGAPHPNMVIYFQQEDNNVLPCVCINCWKLEEGEGVTCMCDSGARSLCVQ